MKILAQAEILHECTSLKIFKPFVNNCVQGSFFSKLYNSCIHKRRLESLCIFNNTKVLYFFIDLVLKKLQVNDELTDEKVLFVYSLVGRPFEVFDFSPFRPCCARLWCSLVRISVNKN